MATIGGINNIKNGLVIALDVNNLKSFRGEPTTNLYGDFVLYTADSFDVIDNSLKWVKLRSSNWCGRFEANIVASGTYNVSFKYRGVGSAQFDNDGINDNIVNNTVISTLDWQTYSAQISFTTTGQHYLYFRVSSGTYVEIKNVQLEQKDHATHFINGTRGTTVATGGGWKDLSGFNNHGILFNSPIYNNGKLTFNGSSNYITTNYYLPSPSTTPTTFELVFKYSANSSYVGLIGMSTWKVSGFGMGFMGNTQMSALYNGNDFAGEYGFSYDSTVITHGIFCFNGKNRKAYRNGVKVLDYTVATDAPFNATPMFIGINGQGGWSNFNGDIYYVRVYNRELLQPEVSQNYESIKSRYSLT